MHRFIPSVSPHSPVCRAAKTAAALISLSCLLPLAGHASGDEWSTWQPLPDQVQGDVDVRLENVGKSGHSALCFQFRNRYDQKVTIAYVVQGEASDGTATQTMATVDLTPGDQRLSNDVKHTQTMEVAKLTGIAVSKITFAGTAPKPNANGTRYVSPETQRLESELQTAQANASAAEAAQFDAQDVNIRIQRSAERSTPLVLGEGQAFKAIMDGKDVAQSKMRVDAAKTDVELARKAVDIAKRRLAESQAMDEKALAARHQIAARIASTRALADAGAWDRVEVAFRAVLDDVHVLLPDPDRALLQLNLGLAQMHQNHAADAQKSFAEACRLAPLNPACHSELAGAMLASDQFDPAAASLNEAIHLAPQDASYHYNLGCVRERQNRFKDAEAAYREAVRLDSANALYGERLKAAIEAQQAPKAVLTTGTP